MVRFDLGPINEAARAVLPGGEDGRALAALDAAIAALGDGPAQEPAVSPPAAPRLGGLSEHYESGGRGPGTVSSGLRDPGGVSYGLYQMATKTGTVAAFLQTEGVRWSRDFIACEPGTPAFSAAWRAVAERESDDFARAQHAFIERTHYRPVVSAVQAKSGLDLDARAAAVRDACWSCAVQHGGAAKILLGAITAADASIDRGAAGYDRRLVTAIYAVRSDYVRRIAATAGPATRRTMLDLAAIRYPSELARALALLDG